jgi:RNA polymerase sigma-70 factor (ECF subfamily)
VVSTISYTVNSSTYADDIVQDALLEILSSMTYFRGDCSLETWARKIAIRVAMRTLKKQRRREGLMMFFRRSEPEQPMIEEFASERELRFQLNSLVAGLPVKQQVAIRFRYVHELSIREISQIVDAPEETVRHRINTGRKKLRKVIAGNPAFEGWLNKESGRNADTAR